MQPTNFVFFFQAQGGSPIECSVEEKVASMRKQLDDGWVREKEKKKQGNCRDEELHTLEARNEGIEQKARKDGV